MGLVSEARVVFMADRGWSMRWSMRCTSWLIEMSLSMIRQKWNHAYGLAALTASGPLCVCIRALCEDLVRSFNRVTPRYLYIFLLHRRLNIL